MRGPGNGTNGYCWLTSTVKTPIVNPNNPVSTLPGQLRGSGTSGDQSKALRSVNVQVTPAPNPRVIVQIDFKDGKGWQQVLVTPAPAGLPSTYKFGFASSTGGSTDIHLISNVTVRSINPLGTLQLSKQVDRTGAPLPAVITAGTKIPYQYVVTNAGITPVKTLSISDDKNVVATCGRTTLDPAPATTSITTCSGTYTVTTTDVQNGSVTNNATANAFKSDNTPVQSDKATVTVPLKSALAISKSVTTPAPYVIGQQVSYAYSVTNASSQVFNLAVSDDRVVANGVICNKTTLSPGEIAQCTAATTIAAGQIAADGTLTNTAVAIATTGIGQKVTSAPAKATIPVSVDMAVTKTVDNATPTVGNQVTFRVNAVNNGPGLASAVRITDLLPTGLQFVSANASVGTYNQTSGIWSIGNVVSGAAPATLTVTATVTTGGALTNAATVTNVAQVDTNSTNDAASVTINAITPTLDIAVTKKVNVSSVRVGQQAIFTITATNNGPFAGSGVIVRDLLPTGLTFVSASDPAYDPGTGDWNIGNLVVGGANGRSMTITVEATSAGLYSNTASLRSVTPIDTNDVNDIETAQLLVTPREADLQVTKAAFPSTATPRVGDQVTYQIAAVNAGPDAVPDAVAADTAVPGLTLISATASQGTFDGANWIIGALSSSGSASLALTYRIDTVGTKSNTATISSATIDDPNPANNVNSAQFATNAALTDIGLAKTGPATVLQNGQATYTVTAKNNGPVNATNLLVSDPVPSGTTFVSSSPAAQYDSETGVWTIGNLASGQSTQLTVTLIAGDGPSYTNAASLLSLDQADSAAGNNQALVTTTVDHKADLAITKVASTSVAQPGDQVGYTITMTNNGPSSTDNVEVVDPLPIGTLITNPEPSQGSFDPDQRVWTVGSMTSGQIVTLTYTITIDASMGGQFLNTAVIRQSSTPDPVIGNNLARASVAIPSADLVVNKSVDNPNPEVGDTVTFTIGASNIGPNEATASVTDLLPAGLQYVSSNPSTGTYDPQTGIWTLGTISPSGPPAMLTVVATVTQTGTIDNTATIAAPGLRDPDLTNNTSTAVITAAPQAADVSLAKTVDPVQVTVGGTATFTLVATNSGPGVATGTVVSDTLPAGLSYVSATGANCTVSGQIVSCAAGDLAVGGTATVKIVAAAKAAGAIINTANVSAVPRDPADPNNAASATLNITPISTPPPSPTSPTSPTPPAASGGTQSTGPFGLPATGFALGGPLPAALIALGLGLMCLAADSVLRRRGQS